MGDVPRLPHGVRWSVRVVRLDDGVTLLDHEPGEVCETASIGKVLLLLTVAERIARGTLDPQQPLARPAVPVADSGLWQHLRGDRLVIADACTLVGAVSDNLATNALIDLVGLPSVAETAARIGLTDTALHDVVRDVRTPAHPKALSTGNARELVTLCERLQRRDAVSAEASDLVVGWLTVNTDLSMVAQALGLDPLAHVDLDQGLRVWNKTGTNDGVRCDMGVIDGPRAQVSYAVLANWTPTETMDPVRDLVLSAMQDVGAFIRAQVSGRPR